MRALWFFACSLAVAADFDTQVHPILAKRCMGCHSGAQPQGGLSLESRATAARVLERGGVRLMSRLNGQTQPQMPPVGAPLSAAEVAIIHEWVNEGAVWPEAPRQVKSTWIAPLEPRDPQVPAGSGSPIDRFLNLPKPELVSDALFARRVYFDLTGLPPCAQELASFTKDQDPLKRDKLIEKLLTDSKRYTDHWISFWNDALHNDIGVVYHGERKAITSWLEHALTVNMPYDQMIRELVNPMGASAPEGFLMGVNWRGDVNASQTPFMQASQNTAQVFLGINLKCASCHDSFINRYKLREAYGLAAMFSESNTLELVRCDNKTGVFTGASFVYPQLGEVPDGLNLAERRVAAARLFTDPRNGRVARTLVNRYWQRLLGRGLVEPVDDMDAEPWNADLLDWLASDFAAHRYDLKHLLRQIMASNAYQMIAAQESKPYRFSGPLPRRLTAEEFVDTVSAVTGEWRAQASGDSSHYVRDWQLKSSPLTRALGRPLRDQVFTTRESQPTTFQALELVNGANLELMLRRGALRLLNRLPDPPANLYDSKVMRKGQSAFDVDVSGIKQLWIVMQDAGSYDPSRTLAGIENAELSGTSKTLRLADQPYLDVVPVQTLISGKTKVDGVQVIPLGRTLIYNIQGLGATRLKGRVVVDDIGQESDVGSSIRLFIFGTEPDRQQLVRVAGERPIPAPAHLTDRDQAIRYGYRALLSRDPSNAELAVARRYFTSTTVQPAALEDLLWSLLLHPECQYIW